MHDNKIDQIEMLMKQMYELLQTMREGTISPLRHYVTAGPVEVVSGNQPVENTQNDSEYIVKLVKSDEWPTAVNPALICDRHSEKDKNDRARGIVAHTIEDDLNGKIFLDFGCGEGHVAVEAANYAVLAVGYDILAQQWNKLPQKDNLYLTTNWQDMKEKGPYDVIMLHDVLDHALVSEGMDAPGLLLKKVADELLKQDGKVYLRVHPWCSRHGTHMYQDLNKAYVHLVLAPQELTFLGFDDINSTVQKVIRPIGTYRGWIEKAGLKIVDERIMKEPAERYFFAPKIVNRIIKHVGLTDDNGELTMPEFQMTVQFIDYVLSK